MKDQQHEKMDQGTWKNFLEHISHPDVNKNPECLFLFVQVTVVDLWSVMESPRVCSSVAQAVL